MKKILALVLAVMLVIGMTPIVSAARPVGPGTIPANIELNLNSDALRDRVKIGYLDTSGNFIELGTAGSTTSTYADYEYTWHETLYPDTQINLVFGFLVNSQDNTATLGLSDPMMSTTAWIGKWVVLSRADLTNNKLGFQSMLTSNSNLLKNKGELKEVQATGQKDAVIRYTVQNPYVSTGDTTLRFSTYVTYDGKMRESSRVNITGTVKNRLQEVYSNADWVYTPDRPVLDVKAYNKSVKIISDFDEKVTVTAPLHEGKKYYVFATNTSLTDKNLTDVTGYPEIFKGYTLNQIGLVAGSTTVRIDAGMTAWVYDEDLNYLGRSNTDLPLAKIYYLSDVDLELDVEPDEDEAPVGPTETTGEAPNPNMGGNDIAGNVNDNPGTGR